jgi:membrane associated rhomboid family serine protease
VFPLRADVPIRAHPAVSVALIVVNVVIYLYEFFLWFDPASPGRASLGGVLYEQFIVEFGLTPCRVRDICPLALETALAGAPPPILTVLTSMFVHGSLLHVGGNMLYLWIFGSVIEDAMGHGRFILFYLVCGIVAAVAQFLYNPASAVPMVGASGAIAGTLGGYLVLYPQTRVRVLVVFGFFVRVILVPALVVLGFWVVLQFVTGLFTVARGDVGEVAVLAHLGGFVAGLGLVHIFRGERRRRRRRWR